MRRLAKVTQPEDVGLGVLWDLEATMSIHPILPRFRRLLLDPLAPLRQDFLSSFFQQAAPESCEGASFCRCWGSDLISGGSSQCWRE